MESFLLVESAIDLEIVTCQYHVRNPGPGNINLNLDVDGDVNRLSLVSRDDLLTRPRVKGQSKAKLFGKRPGSTKFLSSEICPQFPD